jgi:hypothetical protein
VTKELRILTAAREAPDLWRSRAEEIALVLTDMVRPEEVTGRSVAEHLQKTEALLGS